MATKTGELRETLISAIEDVKSGKMDPNKANAIAKLASQINESLKVELDAIEALKRLGLKISIPVSLGALSAGEELV